MGIVEVEIVTRSSEENSDLGIRRGSSGQRDDRNHTGAQDLLHKV